MGNDYLGSHRDPVQIAAGVVARTMQSCLPGIVRALTEELCDGLLSFAEARNQALAIQGALYQIVQGLSDTEMGSQVLQFRDLSLEQQIIRALAQLGKPVDCKRIVDSLPPKHDLLDVRSTLASMVTDGRLVSEAGRFQLNLSESSAVSEHQGS